MHNFYAMRLRGLEMSVYSGLGDFPQKTFQDKNKQRVPWNLFSLILFMSTSLSIIVVSAIADCDKTHSVYAILKKK